MLSENYVSAVVWQTSTSQQYTKTRKKWEHLNTSGGEQCFVFFDLERVHFYKYLVILALFDVK